MNVMSVKDFEQNCKDSVAIGTMLNMLVMIPIHIVGMYSLFIKIDKIFNPHRLMAEQRHKMFLNRVSHKSKP